ncbi:MAG: acyltransferase family protein [Muribaculaceae bacterium]|nr:acyltransferase family protein [Muribaculaceae bacterium]
MKQRLAFIDFMKGLCIMLIVMHHTDAAFFDAVLPGLDNALQSFRVPMYYFLSGLFFKQYNGFVGFLKRKTNNLLVTFLFFHIAGYLVAAVMHPWLHPANPFNWHGLLDPLTKRFWSYTVPLWFLISLFEVNIIYYGLQRVLRPLWAQSLVLAALSVLPLWLASRGMALPLLLDTALVGLPFFVLGHAVKAAGWLQPHPLDKWGMLAFPVVAVVVFCFAGHIDILPQHLPSWPQLYVLPMASILTLLWMCKNIKHPVPVLGTWGRYSIIVLGTHDWLLTPLDTLLGGLPATPIALALAKWGITMMLMLAIIPLMVRYFPRFTAQKPLIKIN